VLFAWKHPTSGLRPLSKKEVVKRNESIKKTHPEIPDLKGHSLRIGGTLHYLLKGVPFDVIKTIGRFEKASLEWCRGNSKVWENPVRENTTHYTVGYTCKGVLRSYLALGCEVT
jgi:hypothetical protein